MSRELDVLWLLIAGAGRQGIQLLGKIMADAFVRDGYNVKMPRGYGGEVRSQFSNVQIAASITTTPHSPFAQEEPDILIAMNTDSLNLYKNRLSKKGILLYNSSIIPSSVFTHNSSPITHHSFGIPATDIAKKIGDERIANMVMLGAYIGLGKTKAIKKFNYIEIKEDSVKKVLKDWLASSGKEELIDINLKAVEEGIKYVKENFA